MASTNLADEIRELSTQFPEDSPEFPCRVTALLRREGVRGICPEAVFEVYGRENYIPPELNNSENLFGDWMNTISVEVARTEAIMKHPVGARVLSAWSESVLGKIRYDGMIALAKLEPNNCINTPEAMARRAKRYRG